LNRRQRHGKEKNKKNGSQNSKKEGEESYLKEKACCQKRFGKESQKGSEKIGLKADIFGVGVKRRGSRGGY
jgi:hypothetical protein